MSVLDLEFSKNLPYKDHSPLVAQQILNNLETNDGINKIYSEIKEILKKYIWDRAKLNEFYGVLEEAFYNDKEEINLKLFFEDEISQFIDDEKKQKEFMGEIINIFKKNKLIPFIAQEKSNWPRVIYKNFSYIFNPPYWPDTFCTFNVHILYHNCCFLSTFIFYFNKKDKN